MDSESTIKQFYEYMHQLNVQCKRLDKPSDCHLEYFKGLAVDRKISSVCESEVKPFLKSAIDNMWKDEGDAIID